MGDEPTAMTPAPSEQSVFAEAILLPTPEARAVHLDSACGTDAALRQRVEALLRAAEKAGDFLEEPPTGLSSGPGSTLQMQELSEQPGDKIGRYKLLQQIGEGGCGVVYMAEQEEPVRRRVALKVIKLGMDTKSVIARFEAERQALALMDHPNIAKVLDAGATETGRPYFVMELVRGMRITDYCDQNNLSTDERLKLFIEVCRALQHAHQKGIIHRDIKPSNILVTRDERAAVPKVIDFGIAKATTAQRLTNKTVFTAFEQFIGTPAYMSPEQAMMTSLDIDTRTDIYALGVLLYELLTGRTPFDANELMAVGLDAMRRTICEKEPARPSTRLSTLLAADLTTVASHRQAEPGRLGTLLRGDLDWIVMKCLEKDRTRRYETANGLAADIRRHLGNEIVMARPPSNWYRLQKWIRRNRLAFAAGSAAMVTIMAVLVILIVSNVRIRHETEAKNAAWSAAQASERQAREQLFMSLRSQAQVRRYSRQMGQRLESLAALEQAAQIRMAPELRDEAIAALALADVSGGPRLPVSQTNCLALALDATGRRYAVLDRQGMVKVRNVADHQQVRRFDAGRSVKPGYARLAFSPDGRFLVSEGDEQETFVWSLENGETVLKDAARGAGAPTFSADSRFLALASSEDVICFDLAKGLQVNRWRAAGRIHFLQFSPTDQNVAVSYKQGPWVSIYAAKEGRLLTELNVGTGGNMLTSWHPDGKQLAVGSTAQGIQIWNVEEQRLVARLESHADEVNFLTYHPSGNWLASWTWDAEVCIWDPATRRQAMQIPLKAELEFSRDGRWLGYFWASEDCAQLLEFLAPQEYFTLQENPPPGTEVYNASAVSPDDRFLAVAMDDGVQVWSLHTRRALTKLPCGNAESVTFDANGRGLWVCSAMNGLQHWTFQSAATNGSIPDVRRIELPFAPVRFASFHNAQTLAIASDDTGQSAWLDTATDSILRASYEHPNAHSIALSSDGEWLATSGWHSDRCRLWNVGTGRLAKDWIVGTETTVEFTPDSRELLVSRGSDFLFLSVQTLEISRRLARKTGLFVGDVAFTRDGKMMAMEMAQAEIHLKETATGSTVAKLKDPFRDRSSMVLFTHDGTKLIAFSNVASAIHIWDLRAIRARLKPMGLDWNWAEFPVASVESQFFKKGASLGREIAVSLITNTSAGMP